MTRPARASAVAALVVAAMALGLCGCVETEEAWTLDAKGAGTYALAIRWNADLVARATAIVGSDAIRRLEGRGFPLRADLLRETLEGLEGVGVDEVVESDLEGGFRELRVKLSFRRIEDLLAWEVLGRRALRVQSTGIPGESQRVEWTMDPLAHLPVIAPLAEIARARGLAAPAEGAAEGEPSAMERFGIRPEDAELLGSMLKPHLQKVRFRFRWEIPGPVTEVGGRPTSSEETGAATEVTFADLVAARDRRVRLAWRPLAFDRVPGLDHRGDPPSSVTADRR